MVLSSLTFILLVQVVLNVQNAQKPFYTEKAYNKKKNHKEICVEWNTYVNISTIICIQFER